jgi:hypothetical protein
MCCIGNAALSTMGVVLCRYVAEVTRVLACPRTSATSSSGTPAADSRLAAECRSSCRAGASVRGRPSPSRVPALDEGRPDRAAGRCSSGRPALGPPRPRRRAGVHGAAEEPLRCQQAGAAADVSRLSWWARAEPSHRPGSPPCRSAARPGRGRGPPTSGPGAPPAGARTSTQVRTLPRGGGLQQQ